MVPVMPLPPGISFCVIPTVRFALLPGGQNKNNHSTSGKTHIPCGKL